jgi:hypothetical protein
MGLLVRKEGERGKRKGKGKGRGGDSIHSCVDGAECVATKARWEGQERLTTGIGRTDNHCTISAEGGNSDHRREEDRSGTFVEKGGGVGPGEKDIKRPGARRKSTSPLGPWMQGEDGNQTILWTT